MGAVSDTKKPNVLTMAEISQEGHAVRVHPVTQETVDGLKHLEEALSRRLNVPALDLTAVLHWAVAIAVVAEQKTAHVADANLMISGTVQ